MSKYIILTFILCSSGNSLAQDRTLDLVREIQSKNQAEYNFIKSMSFSGKSKAYAYFGQKTLGIGFIPVLEEYYFEGYWAKPDTLLITVKAFRKVEPDEDEIKQELENQFPLPNPMRFTYDMSIFNFHNETVKNKYGEKKKIWPVFPFAVGADSLYNYKIISEIGVDARRIVEIEVSPKSSKVPGVVGVFRVDADEKNIVGSKYVFNEAAEFLKKEMDEDEDGKFVKRFINLQEDYNVSVEKGLVNGAYWMPVVMGEEIFAQFWGMKVKMTRELEFTSYEINPEDPPADFGIEEKFVVFARDSVLEKEVFVKNDDPRKLNQDEERALIKNIEGELSKLDLNMDLFDSESVAKNALNMTLGQNRGQKFLKTTEQVYNFALYNRVEGLRLKADASFVNPVWDNTLASVEGGYGIEDREWKWEGSYVNFFGKERKLFFEGNIYDTITFEEDRNRYSTIKNTTASLFIKEDYRDYYYAQGGALGFGFKLTDNLAVKLKGVFQNEQGAKKNLNFGVFNWNENFRPNPDILEGNFKGLKASLKFKSSYATLDIAAEYTDKDNLKSDFDYAYVKSKFTFDIEPNRSSKFVATMSSAFSDGELSPQRWFDFGGKSLFDYYGNLRGVGYKAFTGDKMASGIFEYSMYYGSIIDFDEIQTRWDAYRRIAKITFWTGFGWSELSGLNRSAIGSLAIPTLTTDGLYSEFGISLGDRFNVIRLDLVKNNMSENTVLLSFNFLR